MTVDVVLIGCTKSKRPVPAPARDLYDPSDLFVRRRAYAEASGRPWAVLSARYGVIEPDRVIEPYDFTIRQRLTGDHRPQLWAVGVLQMCFRLAGIDTVFDPTVGFRRFAAPLAVEIHAGVDYVRAVELGAAAVRAPITLAHPVAGMGIGQQKAWYFGQQLRLAGV